MSDAETSVPADSPELPPRESTLKQPKTREVGGPQGPEPTRYGDWERKGRCIDF
ncbi:MAG: DUF1674 domain-containing protein [Chromatiales bacterium]|nr:DUF1674 domain-containing protein [Chromatiales bacterium]